MSSDDTIYCHSCGESINEDASFCPSCGEEQPEREDDASVDDEEKEETEKDAEDDEEKEETEKDAEDDETQEPDEKKKGKSVSEPEQRKKDSGVSDEDSETEDVPVQEIIFDIPEIVGKENVKRDLKLFSGVYASVGLGFSAIVAFSIYKISTLSGRISQAESAGGLEGMEEAGQVMGTIQEISILMIGSLIIPALLAPIIAVALGIYTYDNWGRLKEATTVSLVGSGLGTVLMFVILFAMLWIGTEVFIGGGGGAATGSVDGGGFGTASSEGAGGGLPLLQIAILVVLPAAVAGGGGAYVAGKHEDW
jgi:hypothetical protein